MNTFNRFITALVYAISSSLVVSYVPAVADEPDRNLTQAIDAGTLAVVRIDSQRAALESLPPEILGQNRSLVEITRNFLSQALGQPIYVVLNIPNSKAEPIWRIVADRSLANEKLKSHPFLSSSRPQPLGSSLTEFVPKESPTVLPRFAVAALDQQAWLECQNQVQRFPLQFLFVIPAHFRHAIEELSPTLPAALGSGPSKLLTQGVHWLALGYDPASSEIEITMMSDSEAAAEELVRVLPSLSKMGESFRASELVPPLLKFFASDSLQRAGSRIRFTGKVNDNSELKQLVSASLRLLDGRVSRGDKMDKFRRIVLAMHNYENANKCLPPNKNGRNADNSMRLSWRVHLLPYLNMTELYNRFHLDEPWDSPHNRSLIGEMPDVFSLARFPTSDITVPLGHTCILAPSGENTVFNQNKVIDFYNITDGTSNTIVLLETQPNRAVPWTSPQDFVFDRTKPLDGISLNADGDFVTGFCDGSVRLLPGNLPVQTYLNLFDMSDGNVISY